MTAAAILAHASGFRQFRPRGLKYGPRFHPAGGSDVTLSPPAGSQDHGQPVAAYYFGLFPNTMFNVYPWGVSVNVVKPLAVDRTRVSYLTYVWDASKLERGVSSRLYDRGRYSPTRETGVHDFHRMLAASLA